MLRWLLSGIAAKHMLESKSSLSRIRPPLVGFDGRNALPAQSLPHTRRKFSHFLVPQVRNVAKGKGEKFRMLTWQKRRFANLRGAGPQKPNQPQMRRSLVVYLIFFPPEMGDLESNIASSELVHHHQCVSVLASSLARLVGLSIGRRRHEIPSLFAFLLSRHQTR